MSDNKQPPTTNNQQTTTDNMPPTVVEDTLPPMISSSQPSTVIRDQSSPTIDSGSAAPSDDVVMPAIVTTGPNLPAQAGKKFAGGKFIATILGLFLLIGGIGAGVYLVSQNQNIKEKAWIPAGAGTQGETDTGHIGDSEAGGARPNNDEGNDEDWIILPGNNGTDLTGSEPASDPNTNKVIQTISGNGITCDANTQGVPESKGVCCVPGGGTSYNYETGQPFDGVHWTTCAAGYSCRQTEGCFPVNGTKTTSNEVPSTSTEQPVAPTAQCQNIKAYSPTWALLTTTQLSALTVGSQVNFCVTGSATSESFDRAKFTINGVVQAETTTKRPSSEDFCQLYTIPTGTLNFNVTAQIHHITLGWK